MAKLNKLVVPIVVVVLAITGFVFLALFLKAPQFQTISTGGGYAGVSIITPFTAKIERVDTPYGFYSVYFYSTDYYDSLSFTKITFKSNDGSMINLAKVEHSITYDDGRTVIDDRLWYQENTGTTIVGATDVSIASDMAQAWHKLTFTVRTEANPDAPRVMNHVFYFGIPGQAPEQPPVITEEVPTAEEPVPETIVETTTDDDDYQPPTTDEGAPYHLSILSLIIPIIILKKRRKNED